MKLEPSAEREFNLMLETAAVYWRKNILPPTGRAFIVAEAFHDDIRVTLRNLTVANALRRLIPAHLVVLTGVDEMWQRALNHSLNVHRVLELAEAYGATEVFDLHALVDHQLATEGREELRLSVAGHELPRPRRIPRITPAELDLNTVATLCRLELVPRLEEGWAQDPAYLDRRRRGAVLSAIYDHLFGSGDAVAFVTSHVDYDQWGLGVLAAQRAGVPVINPQSTGSLKAYTLFPETARGEVTFRAELTRQIGAAFERDVWAQRHRLRERAELVAWRAKGNFGRPSWWRAGARATLELSNATERRQLRAHAAARFGLDPDRPTVAVFNHAVSDALWTNREIFANLADWFEQTVAFASVTRHVNWLLLDHPSQIRYDRTNFFGNLAERYADQPHMVFRPSATISKNLLWSLVDLGVTVRGSVSNEMPAYGIPVIQAGWSEWSDCGLSLVASDQTDYWRLLDDAIDTLLAGRPVITPEQVERARLWLWFYRSATDVTSALVPHWDVWPAPYLLRTLRVHMAQVESDGEPVFSAVERMWRERAPFLTRYPLRHVAANDRIAHPSEAAHAYPSILV